MAYLARRDLLFDGAFFHITWQCHNFDWFLEEDWVKQLYYDLLLKYKDRYGVRFFSYSFMDNHPHLTGHTTTVEGISSLMRTVNSQLAKRINKARRRRGQVIMDRFASPVIQTDAELLRVMSYGDLNAPRVKKVAHPKEYRWCSYRFYALGEPDPLITPSPSFLALAEDSEGRQRMYREMVEEIIVSEGLGKRPYSRARYIGDPDWVRARCEELRLLQHSKRQAYLLRQRKMIYAPSPPG